MPRVHGWCIGSARHWIYSASCPTRPLPPPLLNKHQQTVQRARCRIVMLMHRQRSRSRAHQACRHRSCSKAMSYSMPSSCLASFDSSLDVPTRIDHAHRLPPCATPTPSDTISSTTTMTKITTTRVPYVVPLTLASYPAMRSGALLVDSVEVRANCRTWRRPMHQSTHSCVSVLRKPSSRSTGSCMQSDR